jgi:hypothetical protein
VVTDYANKREAPLFYHSRFTFGDFIVEAREANGLTCAMEVSVSGPARPHGGILEAFIDGPVSFAVSRDTNGHYKLTLILPDRRVLLGVLQQVLDVVAIAASLLPDTAPWQETTLPLMRVMHV